MTAIRSVAQIRAEAREHARQIEAVLWVSSKQLAGRWGVSLGTVRDVPREKLPYLTLGQTNVRRYHPDDVAAFEESEKQGTREPEPAA